MLHRIQVSEPVYNRAKWEEDRMAQEKLIRSMSEFKAGQSPPSRERPGSRSNTLKPGTAPALPAPASPDGDA
jgi:hypothetical protein